MTATTTKHSLFSSFFPFVVITRPPFLWGRCVYIFQTIFFSKRFFPLIFLLFIDKMDELSLNV
ncbi:unnamed protein product [Meloidogyne enterolobii]|uniref:Uncharacterized protein n=1 Tax=Meloidogyne enterolobii TaxID=390850 RepID=A0ACB0Y7K6_MELEN